MDPEIAKLEREEIPTLDRAATALLSLLSEARRRSLAAQRDFEGLQGVLDTDAHGAVHVDDTGIAQRLLEGIGAARGIRAAVGDSHRDVGTAWDDVISTIRPIYDDTVHELERCHRRLTELKIQEQARGSGRGGS